jgi:3-dehydroquinate synthase
MSAVKTSSLTGGSVVSEPLVIQSHRGPYTVEFNEEALNDLGAAPPANAHFIVDDRVAELHKGALAVALSSRSVLRIKATEAAKSLDKIEGYVEQLIERSIRRSDILIAVGGGIIQDVTCFVASTLLRGVEWCFYPTTLLAQADSCVGSKSSINVGKSKNLLGTFYPPTRIAIGTRVLETLDERDVRSGVGEMLKVHAIDGPESFDRIAADYRLLFEDPRVMSHYVRRSLELKKRYVEEDEFDRGPRNVMNFGHSFGHAIESATDFAVPHGIAVTLGMDLANYVAVRLGRTGPDHYVRMHGTLAANYAGFDRTVVPLAPFFSALGKDKKNTTSALRLILPDASARVGIVSCVNDEAFRSHCARYFEEERHP